MNNVKRKLSSIVNNEALEYAIYTVENRAIPNMFDGLKPVQRFVLHRAMQLGRGDKDKMHKLASVAGGVADAGYHHGEVSAQDAGALMANTWNNNFPFLDGEGNFGSRLVQQGAAARYVFCRVSDNFRKAYKDFDIAPKHEDDEHLPPKHYLPIIPTVLLNGVKGIATGYATTILPHNLKSVINSTRQAVNGLEIDEPEIQFPKFDGDIIRLDDEPNKYELHGKYEILSKTQMYISEIPYSFDRLKYVEKVLDDLEQKNLITYEDNCSKRGFGFKVKFRKEYVLPTDPKKLHDKIMKDFKLIEKLSQLIVVTDETGKVNDKFEKPSQLIKHFVAHRKTYVQKRIEHMIESKTHDFKLAVAKAIFITKVNNGDIIVKGKTKSELKTEVSTIEHLVGYEDQLVSMNIYHMTNDEVERLKETARSAKIDLEYWKTTTVDVEYNKDLDELEKAI